MKQKIGTVYAFIAAIFFAVSTPAAAVNLIQNGNFSDGLTGWTEFTTQRGVTNTTLANFDVSGSGLQSAVKFYPGEDNILISYPPGYQGQGGGLSQFVNLQQGGSYDFSASVAIQTLQSANFSAGRLSLVIDDVIVDTFNVSYINANTILRSELSFTTFLESGLHKFALLSTREGETSSLTPSHYYTQVALTEVLPEPAAWAMFIFGFGLIGMRMRQQPSNPGLNSVVTS